MCEADGAHCQTFSEDLDSLLPPVSPSAVAINPSYETTDADVLVYNTCSIREKAESKVYSALGKQAMKFYHRSHYNNAGDNLKDDRLRFSFKKGATDLKFYECPVKITRVRKTATSGIGFKETAEKGSVYDYFLAKKAGVSGLPAQVRVFVNEKGEISFDLGSL